MPKATVTVRELKNKDTGIDLSVTSYKEIPGLMRSTFEYQIVVVTSLSCFKLPSHKESDVVQFTLFKKFPEFEELRARLNEAFSGTALPPLLKKSIIVSEAVIKERRNNLDAFVKFISATPRVVTSSHVLTFLGVEAAKARRFASGETDGSAQQQDDGKSQGQDKEVKQDPMTSSNLFEEDEEEEEDFLTVSATAKAAAQGGDEDFFSTSETQSSTARDTRIFESQDLKRELTEEDEKEFTFIPDAIITKREVVSLATEDSENDLLHVDEDIDLDKLLTLDSDSKQHQPQQEENPPSPSKPHSPQKPTLPAKPKPKPKPAPKPTTSPGAKPELSSKPEAALKTSDTTSAGKPATPTKPVPAPRKPKPAQLAEGKAREEGSSLGSASGGGGSGVGGGGGDGGDSGGAKTDMSSDDIMSYIAAADAIQAEADLDLFS